MENKKLKVIAINLDSSCAGVPHYRSIWPSQEIERQFGNEIDITLGIGMDTTDIEYLKQFDIVHFHRQLFPYDREEELFNQLKKHGVITIMDIDDYWSPPPSHPLYGVAQKEKIAEKTVKTLRLSDYVSTTTEIFAKHIFPYNKNVFVLPNGLFTEHKMWIDEDTRKTEKVRIGYCAGSSHLHDLELLKPSMKLLHNDPELKDKYQIIMCGYDVRGHITHINEDGSQFTRKIEPRETVWNNFEEILTDNHNKNVVDENYEKWLKTYKNEEYPLEDRYTKNYVRRWTLPLTQYGKHYNYFDISLAPLQDHTFNEVKSELKLIEAGMKKKVLVAQDYSIHKKLMTHGENGFLISKSMNEKGWYTHLKRLILDKDLRDKLSGNLHEFVKDKYDIKNLTKDRVSFYQDVFNKKQEKMQIQVPELAKV